MALTDITTKIIDDAQTRADEITQAVQKEATAIAAEAEAARKVDERAREARVYEKLAHEEHAALSRARRNARQHISSAKARHISAVIADATKAVVTASDDVYTQFLTARVADLPSDVQIERVLAPSARISVTQSILAAKGITADVVADDTIAAGMLLVGADADYDLTLARRLADIRETIEPHVAQKLFTTE